MKRTKETLKSYFETGDQPTQSQYEDVIDSLYHKDEGKIVKNYQQSEEGAHEITLSDDSKIVIEPSQSFVADNQETKRIEFTPSFFGAEGVYGENARGIYYKTGDRVDITIVIENMNNEREGGTNQTMFIEGIPTIDGTVYARDVNETLFQVKIEKLSVAGRGADADGGPELSYDYGDAYASMTTIGKEVIYIKAKQGNSYGPVGLVKATNGSIRITGTYFVRSIDTNVEE